MESLAFIGCGNMGASMIKALLDNDVCSAESVAIIDIKENDYTKDFAKKGLRVFKQLNQCDIPIKNVVLAVKPQDCGSALMELAERRELEVVISIMAGITIAVIEGYLKNAQIIRCMPNTPASIRSGMSVYCGNNKVKEETYQKAQVIFESFGETIRVDTERMIDAATAISGSGPGYVFYIAEAFQQGAFELGFSKDQARLLATQTILGAARLLNESTDSATELRKKVTSPGGTTQAALNYYDKERLAEILKMGFQEAFKRSLELAKSDK